MIQKKWDDNKATKKEQIIGINPGESKYLPVNVSKQHVDMENITIDEISDPAIVSPETNITS